MVTGVSGSGKTTLSKVFAGKGELAYDIDRPPFSYWADAQGNRIKPAKEELATLKGIRRSWDTGKIKELLVPGRVFLFGMSDDTFEPANLDLFDEKYYLYASKELLIERMLRRAEETGQKSFGNTKAQRDFVIGTVEERIEKAGSLGFRFIDASPLPEEIYVNICDLRASVAT